MTQTQLKHLFDKYYIPCLSYACSLMQSDLYGAIDPQDVAQDVFIAIWRSQPEIIHGAEKSFLFKCIKRKVIDVTQHINHEKRVKKGYQYFAGGPSDETKLIDAASLNRLYDSRLRLPVSCRKIFELAWAGCTTKEIAGLLRISHQNVLNQKQKAIRILKQSLNQYKYTI